MADGVLSRKTFGRVQARRRVLLCGIAAFGCVPFALSGQARQVAIDGEVFRKTADGRRLADLGLGSRVLLTAIEGSWAAVDIEGWVPTSTLGPTTREGHDGVVMTPGGESLRDAPSGSVSGHLLEGCLLHRIEERDGWTRVRRSGWVRMASLMDTNGVGARPEVDRPPPVVAPGREIMTGETPLDLHAAPAGAAVATVESGTPISIVERGNGWTRVRLEGWVRSNQLVTTDPDSVVQVSAAALRASPDDYAGKRVRWTVQFIALELAEPERTDFYEGEPFILARAPDPGDGFVYVAIPSELLESAGELRPLEDIEILAQVRTGRSALMGVPVLDLLALF